MGLRVLRYATASVCPPVPCPSVLCALLAPSLGAAAFVCVALLWSLGASVTSSRRHRTLNTVRLSLCGALRSCREGERIGRLPAPSASNLRQLSERCGFKQTVSPCTCARISWAQFGSGDRLRSETFRSYRGIPTVVVNCREAKQPNRSESETNVRIAAVGASLINKLFKYYN